MKSALEWDGKFSFTKNKHEDIELINFRYIPNISAIVPPLTPGTASAAPINNPKPKVDAGEPNLTGLLILVTIIF